MYQMSPTVSSNPSTSASSNSPTGNQRNKSGAGKKVTRKKFSVEECWSNTRRPPRPRSVAPKKPAIVADTVRKIFKQAYPIPTTPIPNTCRFGTSLTNSKIPFTPTPCAHSMPRPHNTVTESHAEAQAATPKIPGGAEPQRHASVGEDSPEELRSGPEQQDQEDVREDPIPVFESSGDNFSFELPPNQLALLSTSLTKSIAIHSTTNSAGDQPHLPTNPTSGKDGSEPAKESLIRERTGEAEKQKMASDHDVLSRLFDDKLKDVARASDLKAVMEKVDENAANYTRMSLRIKELEVKLNDKRLDSDSKLAGMIREELDLRNIPRRAPSVSAMSALEVASSASGSSNDLASRFSTSAREEGRMRQFEMSRRSLKIWPIEGDDQDSMRAGVLSFMTGALSIPHDSVEGLGIIRVTRVRSNQAGNVYLEVCVEFSNAESRDIVAGLGHRLSGYIEGDRPTAGIRMDIPPFLASTFRTLQNVGYNLKKRHGRLTRKYIKFDDENYDLYLEIRLEGEYQWTRIDSALAREIDRNENRRSFLALTNRSGGQTLSDPNCIPIGKPTLQPRLSASAAVPALAPQEEPMQIAEDDGPPRTTGGLPAPIGRTHRPKITTQDDPQRPTTRLSLIRSERELARSGSNSNRNDNARINVAHPQSTDDPPRGTWRPPPPPTPTTGRGAR